MIFLKSIWSKAGAMLLVVAIVAIAIVAVKFPSLSGLLGRLQRKREEKVIGKIEDLNGQIEAGVGELDRAAEERAKAQAKLAKIKNKHTEQQIRTGAAPQKINAFFDKEGY